MLLEQESTQTAVIFDALPLRGASIIALIGPWAQERRISLQRSIPENLTQDRDRIGAPRFIILNIGGRSLRVIENARWCTEIGEAFPETPFILLSDRQEAEEAVLAARLGVQAFISSNIEPIIALQALGFVMEGGTYFPREALLHPHMADRHGDHDPAHHDGEAGHLTRRQQEVLERLQLGRSNKHIGRDLDMQESTVKVHVRQIMRKLGAANRTQAALLASGVTHQISTLETMPNGHARGPS